MTIFCLPVTCLPLGEQFSKCEIKAESVSLKIFWWFQGVLISRNNHTTALALI